MDAEDTDVYVHAACVSHKMNLHLLMKKNNVLVDYCCSVVFNDRLCS